MGSGGFERSRGDDQQFFFLCGLTGKIHFVMATLGQYIYLVECLSATTSSNPLQESQEI